MGGGDEALEFEAGCLQGCGDGGGRRLLGGEEEGRWDAQWMWEDVRGARGGLQRGEKHCCCCDCSFFEGFAAAAGERVCV